MRGNFGKSNLTACKARSFQPAKVLLQERSRIDRCICLADPRRDRTIYHLPEAVSHPAPSGMHVITDIPLQRLKVRGSRRYLWQLQLKAARRLLKIISKIRYSLIVVQEPRLGFRSPVATLQCRSRDNH